MDNLVKVPCSQLPICTVLRLRTVQGPALVTYYCPVVELV